MSFPLIMQGATLIFEVGDDLEEDVAANYALNLDKVCGLSVFLSVFSSLSLNFFQTLLFSFQHGECKYVKYPYIAGLSGTSCTSFQWDHAYS